MNWLVTNVQLLAALGFSLLVLSSLRIWLVWPWKVLWIPGLILLAVSGITITYIAQSSPGLVDVVPEVPKPDARPPHVKSLSILLGSPWSSESVADWPFSEKMAECCSIAYLAPVDATPAFKALGFEQVEPFVQDSMAGYVAFVDDVAVIVFRGTDDNWDWFVNLDSQTTQTDHGPIHRGFQNAYFSLSDQITKILDKRKPKLVWITGHSLGGALAVACAFDFCQSSELEIAGLITFGQPMLVGPPLVSFLDEKFYGRYVHFVNGSDIVARVVPSLRHCGSLVWFRSDGIYRSKPKIKMFGADSSTPLEQTNDVQIPPLSEEEFAREKERLKLANKPKYNSDGQPMFEGSSPYIADHSMDLYLAAIRKYQTFKVPDAPPAPSPPMPLPKGIGALPETETASP